ncbi:MAG: hypothetical protein HQL69_16060 [Magnetococcales bacterium]|nr:hypothetical protein [Magnetococcales bacterium]
MIILNRKSKMSVDMVKAGNKIRVLPVSLLEVEPAKDGLKSAKNRTGRYLDSNNRDLAKERLDQALFESHLIDVSGNG